MKERVEQARKVLTEQRRLAQMNNHRDQLLKVEAKLELIHELQNPPKEKAVELESVPEDDGYEELDIADLTVKEVEELAKAANDIDVLKDMLELEKSGKDRKTAKDAIEERIGELA